MTTAIGLIDLFTKSQVLAQADLVIDWENLPTYNTIMSVAAGAGLIFLVRLARELMTAPTKISSEGYAWLLVSSVQFSPSPDCT